MVQGGKLSKRMERVVQTTEGPLRLHSEPSATTCPGLPILRVNARKATLLVS